MNYLAHALLSGADQHLVVGNFIADHLRGNRFEGLPPGIIEGIRLHRQIDEFTDQHPLFKKSKRHFYQDFEKYSGILVDIYFDHLLASNFHHWSPTPLKLFAGSMYDIYNRHQEHLPQGSQRFLSYVMSNNVYETYAEEEGIRTVLFHLSHRLNHGVRLDESLHQFRSARPVLEEDFTSFFKEAQARFPFVKESGT